MGTNPHNKRRSDGSQPGNADTARQAKSRQVTGRVPKAKKTLGKGAEELGVRRMLGDIFRDDDEED